MNATEPLRIGILGAAGITPDALVTPAHANPGVRLVAVAARDRARAEQFAREHSIERVAGSYAEVVADPGIQAVYIPLPNSLHAPWTMAALRAGKHVLVEKPFASNLEEARLVAAVAAEHPGQVVMEAFHYRHHALMAEVRRLLDDGIIGEVTEASAQFHITLPDRANIRYDHALSGGATMDLGCYCVHALRSLFGEPVVTSATARTNTDPRLDDALSATMTFPGGIDARIDSSLDEPTAVQSLVVIGTRGSLEVTGFVQPHKGNEVTVTIDEVSTSHEVAHEPTTYAAQLAAFLAAVRPGGPAPTGLFDSLANMAVIDAIYVAAGLGVRPAAPTKD